MFKETFANCNILAVLNA